MVDLFKRRYKDLDFAGDHKDKMFENDVEHHVPHQVLLATKSEHGLNNKNKKSKKLRKNQSLKVPPLNILLKDDDTWELPHPNESFDD